MDSNQQGSLPTGASLYLDQIDENTEIMLMKFLDEGQKWFVDKGISRRTQQYGYKYDYVTSKPDPNCQSIPAEISFGILFPEAPKWLQQSLNQMIVNDYPPGEGIREHTDAKCFGDNIYCLSLGSDVIMRFIRVHT
jgi:alkylated DNA repair dioxygenase AlkB